MLKHNNLSYRRATSVGQKIPLDTPERVETFLTEMKTASAVILHTYKTACYFDLPRTTTYDLSGAKTIKVKTTGNGKLRYSVVLTAGVHKQVDGTKVVKLPPMIIFKNLQKGPKGKFPVGMVVEGTK